MTRSAKLFLLMGTLLAMATACTPHLAQIPTASVSDDAYKNMDCDSLVKERRRVLTTLSAISDDQSMKASRDAFAVAAGAAVTPLFYLLLTGETSGSDEIIRLKGEHDAVNRVISQKRCSS